MAESSLSYSLLLKKLPPYISLTVSTPHGPSDANKGSHASSHIKTTTSHNKVVYFIQVQVTNRLTRRKARVQRKMSTFRKHKLRSIRHLPRPHTPSDKKLKLRTLWLQQLVIRMCIKTDIWFNKTYAF